MVGALRRTKRPLFFSIVGLLLLSLGSPPAHATRFGILGKKLIIKNPTGAEENRLVIGLAKETSTDVPGISEPAGGATLTVSGNGGTNTSQTYVLDASGWTPLGSVGFKYSGPTGTDGDPVLKVIAKRTPGGVALIKFILKGTVGTQSVDVLPPNLGDAGGFVLDITGGHKYCVAFGGSAGGLEVQDDGTQWKIVNATGQCVCGNGVVELGEQCDDNNLLPGDGCDANCLSEEIVTQSVSGGGTVTTDTEADGATAADPLETTITSPNAGTVTITETSVTGPAPAGFVLLGTEAVITAPPAASGNPLVLQLVVDQSQIRAGENASTIQVFRDGVAVGPCVGEAGVALPDPCISARESISGGDVRLTVLTSHASVWTLGVPRCGNGSLDAGEACDPPGMQAQCAAGQLCKTDCQCAAACDCCASSPSMLRFTSVLGAGTCGAVTDASSNNLLDLTCNGLYTGGGSVSDPEPIQLPDGGAFIVNVSGCDAAQERLILAGATDTETGSQRTCTAGGCLFGPPIPVVPAAPSASSCIFVRVAQPFSGVATCDGSVISLAMPLTGDVYRTGDLLPGEPGIQPCPICTGPAGSETCKGGSNDGGACTPGSSVLGDAYPTSQDCPLPASALTGSLTVGIAATSGMTLSSATASGGQSRVFCGYCRDVTGTATQCFDGDATPGCPPPTSGPGDAQLCETDADCAEPFESCQQRNEGAFNQPSASTITLTGSGAGCLADNMPHAATLVAGMCLQPFFDSTVDQFAGLPGPGAASLTGKVQLQ
jgi:cysteine-rich repeat protein